MDSNGNSTSGVISLPAKYGDGYCNNGFVCEKTDKQTVSVDGIGETDRNQSVEVRSESEECSLQRLKKALSWPPHGRVARITAWIIVLLLGWMSLISITGDSALPGGNIFSILVLFICSHLGGYAVGAIGLPPLTGMLVMGIVLRSVPGINVIGNNIDPIWSSTLKRVALTIIVIRAGLGLDINALIRLKAVVVRLAFVPCMFEAATVGVVSHFILGFPWLWAFLLGFVLAAVSPSVTVPCLLQLQEAGLGTQQGIPTLIIAAATGDGALNLLGFGVVLGLIFSSGSLVMQIAQCPIEITIGIVYGILTGFVCWYIPHKEDAGRAPQRFLIVLVNGLLAIFGSKKIGFGGAGALGCIVMALVANIGWRKFGCPSSQNPVRNYFSVVWTFAMPLLFGLIGTNIKVTEVQLSTVGWGLIILVCGLTVRVITTYIMMLGGTLNFKERIFVALAWLPKATVQAAIGAVALDTARANDASAEYLLYGEQVLTIAVLVILATAPIGAAAIMISAPKLLQKEEPEEENCPSNRTVSTCSGSPSFSVSSRNSIQCSTPEIRNENINSLKRNESNVTYLPSSDNNPPV